MNTQTNTLPLSVVSALVARFDRNLDTLHFSGSEVMIHINQGNLTSYGAWRVSMTHISGEEILATLTADPAADFGWSIKYSVCHNGIWYSMEH
jgi:hypothetical protein